LDVAIGDRWNSLKAEIKSSSFDDWEEVAEGKREENCRGCL
jgi:hypothetical protein